MEKRIYVVSVECPRTGTLEDFTLADVCEWDDEKFIEVAESQGWVWSSMLTFAESWNGNYYHMPTSNLSEMRIL